VTDAPLPSLQLIFEASAAAMGLEQGRTRLELVFTEGRLQQYYIHRHGQPRELAAFEEKARWILEDARLR
jgi:hypothetical protein